MKEHPIASTDPGAGEMAERIQAFDWAKTPLGPMNTWSPALITTLRIVLANRFPHVLWWGPGFDTPLPRVASEAPSIEPHPSSEAAAPAGPATPA